MEEERRRGEVQKKEGKSKERGEENEKVGDGGYEVGGGGGGGGGAKHKNNVNAYAICIFPIFRKCCLILKAIHRKQRSV
jgi:hypothetical protein